ncbi:unnamed protein product, partial [Staurois parvus]
MTGARWFSRSGRTSYDGPPILTVHARLREPAARRSTMLCVPRTHRITDHGKSRRCRLGHVISGVQSQLITCKQGNTGYRHSSP